MSKHERAQSEERRRSAQMRSAERAKQAADARREHDRARAAEAAKTARLRALRLAKEAADRERLARAATESPTPKRKGARTTVSAG
jgi:hypothetical protein